MPDTIESLLNQLTYLKDSIYGPLSISRYITNNFSTLTLRVQHILVLRIVFRGNLIRQSMTLSNVIEIQVFRKGLWINKVYEFYVQTLDAHADNPLHKTNFEPIDDSKYWRDKHDL